MALIDRWFNHTEGIRYQCRRCFAMVRTDTGMNPLFVHLIRSHRAELEEHIALERGAAALAATAAGVA